MSDSLSKCPKCSRRVEVQTNDKGQSQGVCGYCGIVMQGHALSPTQTSGTPRLPPAMSGAPPQTFLMWCKVGSKSEYRSTETQETTFFEGSRVTVTPSDQVGVFKVEVICPRCQQNVECSIYARDKWRKARDYSLMSLMASVLQLILGFVAIADGGAWLVALGIVLIITGCLLPVAIFLIVLRRTEAAITYLIGHESRKTEKEIWHRFSYLEGDARSSQDSW